MPQYQLIGSKIKTIEVIVKMSKKENSEISIGRPFSDRITEELLLMTKWDE